MAVRTGERRVGLRAQLRGAAAGVGELERELVAGEAVAAGEAEAVGRLAALDAEAGGRVRAEQRL